MTASYDGVTVVEGAQDSRAGSFMARAWRDLKVYAIYHATWRALAWADIRSKYRRTMLGPWWITATHGFMAAIMALVAGRFLGADMKAYLPHFMVSITVWNFMASCILESSQTLIQAGGMLKSSNMPLAVTIMRMVQRNFVIFAHNFAIVPLVWVFYRWQIDISMVLALFGIALVYVFCAAAATIVSIVCVRYRDVPLLVQAILQLLFFVSPIIWMPDQVRGGQLAMVLNPMNYMLAVVRDPILGKFVAPSIWLGAVLVTVATVAIAALINSRYRKRVVFWV